MTNTYDRTDMIRQHKLLRASGRHSSLKIAAYSARDPETGEFSQPQVHMTQDNCVLAVMPLDAAKMLTSFIVGLEEGKAENPWRPIATLAMAPKNEMFIWGFWNGGLFSMGAAYWTESGMPLDTYTRHDVSLLATHWTPFFGAPAREVA